ncbi:MAG: lipid-A-disaccharide synthase [Muribaculaceae bacterium]|nr:lipid-A-disaccharide synthase [Muribaculaceae bacterium]
MKYFFSAGEASGDIHAAAVMRELRAIDPEAQFMFLGGDEMAAAAGHAPVIHYSRMAFMGFIDVARHLPQVLGNLRRAKEAVAEFSPDIFIPVDYPSFNLRLADYAHGRGIPVHYFIAPKLWAWKEYRIKKMRRCVDRIYSILPFEPQWFGERGVAVDYVGNPSVEEVREALCHLDGDEAFRREHGLDSRPILAIVPGSRVGEIKANLPVMHAVARRHPGVQPLIAGAPAIDPELYALMSDIPVIHASTLQLMAVARAALVTSGTASLESALAGAPQVVCYRSIGSPIAHDLFMHILKIPYVSLPNLVGGDTDRETRRRVNAEVKRSGVRRDIVPEMLMHHCSVDEVDRQLAPLLSDTPERKAQLDGYARVAARLSTPAPAAATTARLIYESVS